MGISDEIEDATIAIDETKISEIKATRRRSDDLEIIVFRQNISQSDLKIINMKMSLKLVYLHLIKKKKLEKDLKGSVCVTVDD